MSIIPGMFFNRRGHFAREPFSIVELPEPFLDHDDHRGGPSPWHTLDHDDHSGGPSLWHTQHPLEKNPSPKYPPLDDHHHRGHTVTVPPPLHEAVSFLNTRIERKETQEAHVYEADLPGLNKHEVKVEVEDGRVLCIRGEKKVEKEEKTEKWHLVEHGTRKFVRRFRLPENAKVEKMRTCMENGVLTVTFPKDHEAVKKHHTGRAIPIY